MSFEDFASSCNRTFSQTPIRLIRISSSLSSFAGSNDPPYQHLSVLCQPHFTSTSISIAFYLNGTAYFENLNEEKIRQRLQLLNNPRTKGYHKGELEPVLTRIKSMLVADAVRQDGRNEVHVKLLSSILLSIEVREGDLKFKFRCTERPDLYEQYYVRQLLIQVNELAQRQAYLCELLEHKDELPQFDAQLFLSTPMTLVDEQAEADDEDETFSSSIGRLWKSAFGRRGAQHFLDICLLKKRYMKALEEMGDDDQDSEAISSVVQTIVDQTVDNVDEQCDDDEMGLAARMGKRSMADNGAHQMKRLRSGSNATAGSLSV